MKWILQFVRWDHDKYQSTKENIEIIIDVPDGFYLKDIVSGDTKIV